jgi:uncharacterized protein YndB with AHSA1/START domain
MSQTPDVTLVRTIPAPPQKVFEAWLDERALLRFMCPAEGTSVSKVEVDARVGGSFLIVMNVGGQDLPHRGQYLEIERYQRLVFSWNSVHAGEGSRVTLRFEPLANEQTRLTLEHVGLSEPARAPHESGWTHIIGELTEVLRSSRSG